MEIKTSVQIEADLNNKSKETYIYEKWVRVADVVSMLEFFDSCNEDLLLDTAIKTNLLELKKNGKCLSAIELELFNLEKELEYETFKACR